MNSSSILICGGAGYIGSHMAQWLAEHGHVVTVLDNLSTGHRDAVRWGDLIEADLLDPAALERAFHGRSFDTVMHFCARSLVGESVVEPYAYYANSYVCRPVDDSVVRAWSTHEDDRFAAVVRSGCTVGVQFHPEKSSGPGLRFLHAFLDDVTS